MSPGGTVIPLGAWSGKSWEEISQALAPSEPEARPIAQVLVSDGEPGLAEGLAQLANEQQRCHWHQVRDLGYFMWRDKRVSRAVRKAMQHRLSGIIGIELPGQDFQVVSEADKAVLGQKTDEAERQLAELVSELSIKGYHQAAAYIRNAKEKLFTYVRMWLKYGIVAPRVISLIERMMREIGRRLKRIAFGWSESGAARMARIIIKRITNAGEWDAYWAKKLRVTGKVKLIFDGVQLA